MKTTNNNKKSKLLALLLSVMMLSSMGAAFASCADGTDSSSSPSSSSSSTESEKDDNGLSNDRVDNGTIKNGHFDFTTINETVKIGTSVTGWTRSTDSGASSSQSDSGVIDTANWDDLTTRTKNNAQIEAMEIQEAIADWENLTTADKLAFYNHWENRDDNKKKDIEEEFDVIKEDVYESFNIDYADLPEEGMADPGRAPEQALFYEDGVTSREEIAAKDYQVLMIHNNSIKKSVKNELNGTLSKTTTGTAQKFTSSSFTVKAGTAGTFSVWVKTADLKCVDSSNESQDAVGKGAYISLTQTIGGKTLDAYTVKNINTETMDLEETDGWKEYEFYLKGSSFADTTYTIVLGLGQGSGSDKLNYVNGYAFFDNIQFKELSLQDYNDAMAMGVVDEVTLSTEKEKKTVDVSKDKTRNKFALNFYGDDNGGWKSASDKYTGATATLTEGVKGATINEKLKATDDVMQRYANRDAIERSLGSNDYLKTVYNNYIVDTNENEHDYLKDVLKEPEILLMLSTKGAAYTWEKAYTFTMPEGVNYTAVSFLVKTSDFEGGTAPSVTLEHGDESTSFSSINTHNLEGVTIDTIEDYYDGWQRCYFFVEKSEELQEENKTETFHLTFNYGPSEITVDTAETSLEAGWVAFADFQILQMDTLAEYECAQTGTYAQKYTLLAEEEETAKGNVGFDTTAATPTDAIKEGFANPQNYKGVYSDSLYVTLPEVGTTVDENDDRRFVNKHLNAGLLNREYFADIVAEYLNEDNTWKSETPAWLKAIAGSETDAEVIWRDVFGNGKDNTQTATQPLFIWNNNDLEVKDNDGNVTGYTYSNKSYGYIGPSTAISEDTVISIRVKTSEGAKASVYLVDMDDETRQSYLSVGSNLIYWYDDIGNILSGDPEKGGKIAFRLEKSTGLYYPYSKWDTEGKYEGKNTKTRYANLSAYTEGTLKEGNQTYTVLFAADDSATHSYHDSTWNRAVYYKDGNDWYTEPNGDGYKVIDFRDVTDITPRYDAQSAANHSLKVENIETHGEWVTVTFYIKKGNVSKNCRLEVWSSGERAGDANSAGTYVAFDTATASFNNYDSLLERYKEKATNLKEPAEGAEIPENYYFESVFSYYDTDKHVRYDKDSDIDEVGNLYEDRFKASEKTAGVAYLYYHEAKSENGLVERYTVFADYSLSEASVTPGSADTDDDDTDTDDTTETDEDATNVWMLAGSIAVAAALLVAVGSIAVRRTIKFIKKRKASKVRVNIVKINKNKKK